MSEDFFVHLLKSFPLLMRKLMHDLQPPSHAVRLNRSQWKALFLLDNLDKPNMSQLSGLLNLEKGSLTTVIDGLIEKGLVQRAEDKQDRRKIRLDLTSDGKKSTKNAIRFTNQHIKSRLDALEKGDREALVEALQTITSLAEKL